MMDVLAERLPRTLVLFLTATAASFYIGFLLGKAIAWRRGGLFEYAATISGATLFTTFTPAFALMMIWVFAFRLGWFPVGKFLDPLVWRGAEVSANFVFGQMLLTAAAFTAFAFLAMVLLGKAGRIWPMPAAAPVIAAGALAVPLAWAFSGIGGLALDILKHMVLPIATLTLISFAGTMLLTRNSMLETIREDYVMAARAKGLPENVVRDRHAARHAARQRPVAGGHQPSLQPDFRHRRQRDNRGCFLLARHRHDPAPGGAQRRPAPGHGRHAVHRAVLPAGPCDCGCTLRVSRPEDTLPVISPQLDRPSTPGESPPEPPGLDLGRGRLNFTLTRLRLAWRSLRSGWAIFMESRVGVLSLFTIIIFALMALSHPVLMMTVWDSATYDPVTGYAFDQVEQPAPPSWRHPLGTDPLGRDVLSQLLYSTRSEFVLGITAALVTVGIATIVGAVAAYYGGVLDAFFMRLADLIIALPAISLLIVLSALFNLNLFYWP